MNKEFLPTPEYQIGRGGCEVGKPCQFHATKVSGEFTGIKGAKGSVNPPESVWAVPSGEHWASLSALQKQSMHDAWSVWQEQTKKDGWYPAGSWMSSPEQLEQFVTTMKALKRSDQSFTNYLRVGTASGVHTLQELNALKLAGIQDVHFSLVEPCLSAVSESKKLLGSYAGSLFQGTVEQLPMSQNGQWDIVTAHFTESFVPTIEEYEEKCMNHTLSMEKKKAFYKKIHDLLKQGGFFVSCIGAGNHPRRLQNDTEIMSVLVSSGFDKHSIYIVPTTESLDYENGHYLSGNFFVVAQKGKTYEN